MFLCDVMCDRHVHCGSENVTPFTSAITPLNPA